MVHCIPFRDCDSICIGETSRIGTIRIKKHKRAFNSGDIKSKLVFHALETDHVPNFDKVKVLASGVNIYHSRMFLEGVFTKLQPAPLNEARTMPSEYTIFY